MFTNKKSSSEAIYGRGKFLLLTMIVFATVGIFNLFQSTVFAATTFDIVASVSTTGTINPPGVITFQGVTTYNQGDSVSYIIEPNYNTQLIDVQVDGVSVGPVTSYDFTNIQANHVINADFADMAPLTITASAGPNGTISPSGNISVPYFDIQTFIMNPDPGFGVQDVLVDGVSVGAFPDYSFTDVVSNHTIEVTFTSNTFNIMSSASLGGTIDSSFGTDTVLSGSMPIYAFYPDPNYYIADVLVDGVSMGPLNTYTFDPVSADHTIHVDFAIDSALWIVATAGPNGTISPLDSTNVNFGDNLTYTITPDIGYQISDVVIDGITSVGPVSTYTFSNIIDYHTIEVFFEPLSSYDIIFNSGWNLITLPVNPIDPATNQPINYTAESFGN
ncbi:MAG: hypothetical protein WA057_01620, partial [Candidatus Magasanikiibacteriota bacterium]